MHPHPESSWPPEILFVAGFVIILLFGINFVSSHGSGWSALSALYRFSGVFDGEKIYVFAGRVGTSSRVNGLLVGGNSEGLFVSASFLAYPFFPPLLIPWEDILTVEKRHLLGSSLEISSRRVPDVVVVIPADVGHDLIRYDPNR